MTRRDKRDAPPLGEAQAISIRQALDMYTRGAGASLPFTGVGVIAPGNKADIAVLSQNLLTVDPYVIEKTVAEITISGGRIVHE